MIGMKVAGFSSNHKCYFHPEIVKSELPAKNPPRVAFAGASAATTLSCKVLGELPTLR